MNEENFSDNFKEADEVADGMIPDSQIIKILNQISSAKDQIKQQTPPADDQELIEKNLNASLIT